METTIKIRIHWLWSVVGGRWSVDECDDDDGADAPIIREKNN